MIVEKLIYVLFIILFCTKFELAALLKRKV